MMNRTPLSLPCKPLSDAADGFGQVIVYVLGQPSFDIMVIVCNKQARVIDVLHPSRSSSQSSVKYYRRECVFYKIALAWTAKPRPIHRGIA